MRLVTKRSIRFIKLFLVSTVLEKILVCSFLILLLLIVSLREFVYYKPEVRYRESALTKSLEEPFYQVNSLTSYIDWIENTVDKNIGNSPLSTFKPFGAMLLTQIRIKLPTECNQKTSTNGYEESFSVRCNPQEVLEDMIENLQRPNNRADCIGSDCQEFDVNTDSSILNIQSDYIKYPIKGFIANLPFSSATGTTPTSNIVQNITKIRTNNWLSEQETMMLDLKLHAIEPNSLIPVQYSFTLERYGTLMYSTKVSRHCYPSLKNQGQLLIFLLALFIINGFLYLFKNLYEFSIQENKLIYLCAIMGSLLQVIAGIVTLSLEASFRSKFPNLGAIQAVALQDTYYSFGSSTIFFQSFETLSYAILVFIIILRFFSFLTWFKLAASIRTISRAIYRTFPSVIILATMSIAMSVSWAGIFFNSLGSYERQFAAFSSSLINFFFFQINNYVMEQQNDANRAFPAGVNLEWMYLLMWVLRSCLALMIIATMIEAYRKAASFEFHQATAFEVANTEFLSDIQRRIEKFNKEYLPENDDEDTQRADRRMIIWLNLGEKQESTLNELQEQLEESNIHLVYFVTDAELINFLRYLFQLKPGLLYRSSHMFRLVIYINVEQLTYQQMADLGVFDTKSQQALFLKQAEKLLVWMKGIGGRIPIMLYSEESIKYELEMQLRQKYNQLFLTNKQRILTYFALMNDLSIVRNVTMDKSDGDDDDISVGQESLQDSFYVGQGEV